MQNDLISIIVTVHNEANLLYRSIFSIIKQTYKLLEIIIVDDGSNTQTALICDHIKLWDNRIKVYHKDNGGLSDARNFGLKKANGKYVCFVDADDWVDEEMYEALHDAIIKFNTKMSMCKMRKIQNNKKYDFATNEKPYLAKPDDYIPKMLFEWNHYGNYAWNKMFDKTCFNNIKFPKDRFYEDKYIMYKIALKCKNIVVISQSYYNYYYNNNSICNTISLKHVCDDMDAYDKLLSDPLLKEYNTELLWACLNSAKWFFIRSFSLRKIQRIKIKELICSKVEYLFERHKQYWSQHKLIIFFINYPYLYCLWDILCYKGHCVLQKIFSVYNKS